MNTTHGPGTPFEAAEQTAAAGSAAGIVLIVVCGVLVTAALVWAVRFGTRVRAREQSPGRTATRSGPPRPTRRPVDQERLQRREPGEVPQAGPGDRPLTPHELGNAPDRPSESQERPRRRPGSGGSFGSGGH
ncbi:DUF6479 family protein [Streptomyces sp. SS7]|uniref:DUF6479 family protein n=1 Tax=Streptomyces sp. SS7 TaxID=3108485 RepID=UPI0030EBBC88